MVTATCCALALLSTPRGRITKAAFSELQPGMSLHEASRVIALAPGFHDGVSIAFGLPQHVGNSTTENAAWVCRSGAICVRTKDGRIFDLRHLEPQAYFIPGQFRADGSLAGLVIDRVFFRFVDYRTTLTPALIPCVILIFFGLYFVKNVRQLQHLDGRRESADS